MKSSADNSRRITWGVIAAIAIAIAALLFLTLRPSPVSSPLPSAKTTIAEKPQDRDLQVGFPFTKPPYVIQQSADINPNAKPELPGLEIEIFTAAMQKAGIRFKPVFQPFAKIITDLSTGVLDAGEAAAIPLFLALRKEALR